MRGTTRAAASLAGLVLCACPPPQAPPGEEGGPPAPDRFATAECSTEGTNPAAEVEIGAGYGEFTAATEDEPLPIVEVDGETYAYFSVRVRYTHLESVCLQYRLDLAEPERPNEAVSFDRFVLALDPEPDGGGIVRGIAAPIEDAQEVSRKRALLVIDVADALTAGHAESFTRFE